MMHLSEPSNPPCCLPTLTEVVQPACPPETLTGKTVTSDEIQELMVQRVLQRIDQTLERRLHDAVEQLILEHTVTLMPRIREEVELVVRECVTQAFEAESTSLSASPET